MRSCLICDDHLLMRDALAMTVQAHWPAVVFAFASTFGEAWDAAAQLSPQLCMVDLVMPGAAERVGVAKVQAAAPAAKIVVVTGSQDDALLLDLLAMGIDGFVPKTCGSAIVLAALDLVLAGGRYLPARVADLADRGHVAGHAARETKEPVTPRQREILELVAQGMSNKEIARALAISPATVKTHVAQAIAVVGGVNRTDAAIKLMLQRG